MVPSTTKKKDKQIYYFKKLLSARVKCAELKYLTSRIGLVKLKPHAKLFQLVFRGPYELQVYYWKTKDLVALSLYVDYHSLHPDHTRGLLDKKTRTEKHQCCGNHCDPDPQI